MNDESTPGVSASSTNTNHNESTTSQLIKSSTNNRVKFLVEKAQDQLITPLLSANATPATNQSPASELHFYYYYYYYYFIVFDNKLFSSRFS
jgi:hypothetical protein